MNTPRVSLGPRWQRFWKISEKRFIEINGDVDDHWSSFCRSCDPSLWPPESCSIPTPRLQYNCLWYGTSIFLSFDSIHFDHPEFAVVTVSASSIIWLGSVAERHTAAFLAYRPPLTCSPTATSTLLFSFSFPLPRFLLLPSRQALFRTAAQQRSTPIHREYHTISAAVATIRTDSLHHGDWNNWVTLLASSRRHPKITGPR